VDSITITYQALLNVQITHAYFIGMIPKGVFTFIPSKTTQAYLESEGIRFDLENDGFRLMSACTPSNEKTLCFGVFIAPEYLNSIKGALAWSVGKNAFEIVLGDQSTITLSDDMLKPFSASGEFETPPFASITWNPSVQKTYTLECVQNSVYWCYQIKSTKLNLKISAPSGSHMEFSPCDKTLFSDPNYHYFCSKAPILLSQKPYLGIALQSSDTTLLTSLPNPEIQTPLIPKEKQFYTVIGVIV